MVHYTIDQCNEMAPATFVSEFGDVYESSHWVPERALSARPFSSIDDVQQSMRSVVDSAATDRKLALLRAHPDLGARTDMTDASAAEQASAGLDSLSPDQYDRFQSLTETYQDRFGFPFIMAVRGSGPDEIERAMRDRIDNDPETEFSTALEAVHTIAELRLTDLLTAGNSPDD